MNFPLTYKIRLVSGTVCPLEGVNLDHFFWGILLFNPQKLAYLHYFW